MKKLRIKGKYLELLERAFHLLWKTILQKKKKENNDIDIINENDNLDGNDDKKNLPLFGVYNPYKINPKFFVDNNFNKK